MLNALLFMVLIALLLHLPYRWDRSWDFLGRESGAARSVLYRYAYGPAYEQLDYDGLRRLQTWLLLLIGSVTAKVEPELLARIIEIIRQLLGL